MVEDEEVAVHSARGHRRSLYLCLAFVVAPDGQGSLASTAALGNTGVGVGHSYRRGANTTSL